MGEIGGGIAGVGEGSSGGNEGMSSGETASTGEFGSAWSTAGGELTGQPAGSEALGGKDAERVSVSSNEVSISSSETPHGTNQILEVPFTLEQAQRDVEAYHQQSIEQILEMNGKYMSEADRARISGRVDSIQAVRHDPFSGRTGGYLFSNGKSSIEVSAIDQQQMERSTKHETNHFASKNREIIVPEPDKKGYTVYQTVGMRQSSWFHSNETGEDSNYTSRGRGLNEGLTTMYTNQQLTELSKEKGEAAERQEIYSHATELCTQLESIVGKDALKEAYYGGNMQELEAKVDSLTGERGFEALRESLDRTLSRDYGERVQAMKEAQSILAKMYDEGGGRA